MTICYYVPGLGGSSLGTSTSQDDDTWVSYTALALGLVGRMRLGPDGIGPGPPDGVQLTWGHVLADYYGESIRRLRDDLRPHGYVVHTVPYDWRWSARRSAQGLVFLIRTQVSVADPCSIVAHSFGGLVARMAWLQLAETGEQAKVRRIVTLGTPHWGSYGAVRLWSLDSEQLSQVFYLSLPAAVIFAVNPIVLPGRIWTPQRLAALSATWPSLYETLPSLLGGDVGGDPERAVIFGDQWPGDRGVSRDRLNDATQVWQPLLANASSIPPSAVMTTVAGRGQSTGSRFRHASIFGDPYAYSLDGSGDGQVTVADAHLANAAQVTVVAGHADLPVVLAASGQLAELVLDPRSGPGPAPAPVTVTTQLGPILAGPPSPQPITPRASLPLGETQYDP